ncbi:PAS domain-containing protein, partial [Neptuniibacter sp.]|uniref:PAS domain-containing protein n=1 Tax=Neptuniibacter sp. TaxID=1962643 RepID=UPI00262B52C1
MNNVDERVLVSLCPDPVIGVDGAGIIQLFNAAAEKLLGYAAVDVVGKLSITSIYPDLDSARQIKRLMFSDECGE